MNKKYITYIAWVFIVLALVLVAGFMMAKKKTATQEVSAVPSTTCFVRTDAGDRDVLEITIIGDKATGSLDIIPAEKDKKTGTFAGTMNTPNLAGMIDTKIMGDMGTFWWKASAEGMTNTEELRIRFRDTGVTPILAYVGFGQMKDNGDGTYGYADPSAIDYSLELREADCATVHESAAVEAYIRGNADTLIAASPVLGGAWYITGVSVDQGTKTGSFKYEDGHIAGTQTFSYDITGNAVRIYPVVDYTAKPTATYVTFQTWPPKVLTSSGKFACAAGGTANSAKGKTVQRDINGNAYCVTAAAEGAAGSTYTTYTYSTLVGETLAKTTFIARTVQCMNYDEPQQSACKAEQKGFSIDSLADGLIHQLVK